MINDENCKVWKLEAYCNLSTYEETFYGDEDVSYLPSKLSARSIRALIHLAFYSIIILNG